MRQETITIKTGPVNLLFSDMLRLFDDSDELLEEVGLFVRLLSLERTARGVDWKGIKFRNYSPFYAFYRDKKGRPTSNVDLFFSGKMLGSLKTKVSNNSVRLYFASELERKKAAGHNYGTVSKSGKQKLPMRHFFDITPEDVSKVTKIVDKWFDKGVI